jgi:hypothetical protein
MPVIQRDSSGGWTWTRPTGSPSCSASQALAGRTARAAWVSARTSSSVAGRRMAAEQRVVADHAHLELGHDVEVGGPGLADDQALAPGRAGNGGLGPGRACRDHGDGLQPVAQQRRHTADVAGRPGDHRRGVVGASPGQVGQVIAPLPYQVVEGGGRVGLAQPRDQREPVRRTPGLAQRAGLDMLVTAGRQPGRAAVGPGGHERRRASLGEFSPGRQQPVQPLPAAAHRAVDLVDRVPDDPGHCRASDISRPPPHGATALPRFATHYTVPGNDH